MRDAALKRRIQIEETGKPVDCNSFSGLGSAVLLGVVLALVMGVAMYLFAPQWMHN